MSTAWYRSNVVPSLVRRWKGLTITTNTTTTTTTRTGTGTGAGNSATPKTLLHAIEVWDTTCVVTNFGKKTTTTTTTSAAAAAAASGGGTTGSATSSGSSSATIATILINPANPNLSGVSDFSYFPKGGPQPTKLPAKEAHPIMGYVTRWGGMEVGQGMMFAANVVDGLVHQLGGPELREALRGKAPCPEGQAVWTDTTTTRSSGGGGSSLSLHFDAIVHTVPPFYGHADPSLLEDCYRNSLQLIHDRMLLLPPLSEKQQDNNNNNNTEMEMEIRVACPLLGAGCRGFPTDEAIERAANVLVDECCSSSTASSLSASKSNSKSNAKITLAFAIPNGELRQSLIEAIDRRWAIKKVEEERRMNE